MLCSQNDAIWIKPPCKNKQKEVMFLTHVNRGSIFLSAKIKVTQNITFIEV